MTGASPSFRVETLDSAAGARVLKLIGPLTIQTLFDFQKVVRKETARPLILDLSAVPYMDSAGLGCVISAYTSCQRDQRAFALTGISDRIRTLFKVTRVDGLIPCCDSLAAAEAFVAASNM